MIIQKLTEKDILETSKLIARVIKGTPYYPSHSQKEEIHAQAPEKISRRLKNKHTFYFVAKDGSRIIGFVFGSLNTGLLHIYWIGVDPYYRKKGTAGQLVKSAEVFGKKKKAHKIWLDTRINNKESISLFKKLKYKKSATLKKHYWGLDFFIWEKVL